MDKSKSFLLTLDFGLGFISILNLSLNLNPGGLGIAQAVYLPRCPIEYQVI